MNVAKVISTVGAAGGAATAGMFPRGEVPAAIKEKPYAAL